MAFTELEEDGTKSWFMAGGGLKQPSALTKFSNRCDVYVSTMQAGASVGIDPCSAMF